MYTNVCVVRRLMMSNKEFKEQHRRRHHDGDGRKDHSRHHGAKTFRRGRAIAFLERMKMKRSTIMQQLEKSEFQSIQQVLVGELKAIDMVINEFSQLFEIQESEVMDAPDKKKDDTDDSAFVGEESLHQDQEI